MYGTCAFINDELNMYLDINTCEFDMYTGLSEDAYKQAIERAKINKIFDIRFVEIYSSFIAVPVLAVLISKEHCDLFTTADHIMINYRTLDGKTEGISDYSCVEVSYADEYDIRCTAYITDEDVVIPKDADIELCNIELRLGKNTKHCVKESNVSEVSMRVHDLQRCEQEMFSGCDKLRRVDLKADEEALSSVTLADGESNIESVSISGRVSTSTVLGNFLGLKNLTKLRRIDFSDLDIPSYEYLMSRFLHDLMCAFDNRALHINGIYYPDIYSCDGVLTVAIGSILDNKNQGHLKSILDESVICVPNDVPYSTLSVVKHATVEDLETAINGKEISEKQIDTFGCKWVPKNKWKHTNKNRNIQCVVVETTDERDYELHTTAKHVTDIINDYTDYTGYNIYSVWTLGSGSAGAVDCLVVSNREVLYTGNEILKYEARIELKRGLCGVNCLVRDNTVLTRIALDVNFDIFNTCAILVDGCENIEEIAINVSSLWKSNIESKHITLANRCDKLRTLRLECETRLVGADKEDLLRGLRLNVIESLENIWLPLDWHNTFYKVYGWQFKLEEDYVDLGTRHYRRMR